MHRSNNRKHQVAQVLPHVARTNCFTSCAGGWMFEGNHHRHYIQIVDDCLQCSCATFKRNSLAGQLGCMHTRAVEKFIALGKLVRPSPVMLPLASAHDLIVIAPT